MFEYFMYKKNDTYNLFEKNDLKIREELDKRLFTQKILWYLIFGANIYCVYNINLIIHKFGIKGEILAVGLTSLSSFILIINLLQIIKRSIYLYKIKMEFDKDDDGIKFVYSKLMFKKWYIFVYQSIILAATILKLNEVIINKLYLNILIILLSVDIIRLLLKLGINKFRILMIKISLENIIEEKDEEVESDEYLSDAKELEFLFGTRYVSIVYQLEKLIEKLKEVTQKEKNSIYSKSQLVTNLSHDLKTPLTSIINSVYILKNEQLTDVEKVEQVNILKDKSVRLKTLIDNLNEVINSDEDEMILNKEEVNVYELLNQCISSFQHKIEESNLNLKFNINDENVIVLVDKDKIIRVFENLLSNIVKYSLEDTRVYIDLKKEEGFTYITFKNISKYELEIVEKTLGNRFVKGDKSRHSDGYGLGLSIVKNLIRVNEGNVNITTEGDLFKVSIILKNLD